MRCLTWLNTTLAHGVLEDNLRLVEAPLFEVQTEADPLQEIGRAHV